VSEIEVGTEVFVFGSILHRMILWELTKVFVIALVGITGILLMAGIITEASQQGLGPGQILAAIPLLIPSTLPYTIPATTLFATCVVYGRLAADNEILAIKSAGINLMLVVKPGLVLGVAMSTATLGLYYQAIPYTHRLLRALVYNDAEEFIYAILKKHGSISYSQMPWQMYVQSVRGRKLLMPVIKHKDSHSKTDLVATGDEAELHVDMSRRMILVEMSNCTVTSTDGSRVYFLSRTFEVELPSDFGSDKDRRPRDMTWPEILRRRVEDEEEMEKLSALISVSTAQMLLTDVPWDFPQHIAQLNERMQSYRLQRIALDVELLMRPALSIGCLFFILVGCPVGIWFSRSDFLSSFITCFLPIVFIYYPLMLCGTGMAKEGRLPPIPLVYGADAVVGAMGLFLFWRLLKN
jgi:lipopolysaccharide export system permease protein